MCILLIGWFVFAATVRQHDGKLRERLAKFGQFVAQCMPRFVQKVLVTGTDELEVGNLDRIKLDFNLHYNLTVFLSDRF